MKKEIETQETPEVNNIPFRFLKKKVYVSTSAAKKAHWTAEAITRERSILQYNDPKLGWVDIPSEEENIEIYGDKGFDTYTGQSHRKFSWF